MTDANAPFSTRPRDAEPPFVLALDAGTSSFRVAIFDSRGREIEGTRARLERDFRTTPDGGAELDADAAVAEIVSLIDKTLAETPREILTQTEALTVACFWHSLVGIDADAAVTPVYGWADTRAARQAERLRRERDERDAHARTGCRFHPSYWPAKLLWIREERPREWSKAVRWMSFGEFLTLRLCGEASASVSMASGTGLFNQHLCEWDAPLLGSLNLSVEQLPLLAHDGQTFTLTREYAERWPELRVASVFPAIGDGAANNVGAGCTTRESVALMVGTSGAMRVAYEGAVPRELHESLWCYRVDRRRVVVGGALSDGGGLFDWMRDAFMRSALDVAPERAKEFDGEALEEELAAIAPDAHGLTVLPFWSGERSTGWHAQARGAILGLTSHTRPVEIVRAGLEAVAYRFALISDALLPHAAPHAEICASGGALRASSVWTQIIADALGRPIRLSSVEEASSRGAVLLALEALGKIKDVADTKAPPGDLFEPDMSRHDVYRRGLQRQQKFYELLVTKSETPHANEDT